MLDHFQNPRNVGEVENPDASVQLENPACGDVMRLAIKVTEGRVSEIRFQAKGCVPMMACGSAITELVWGKTISQAAALTREDLIAQVGGLPEASAHASHLAMDILARALCALRQANP
jgi:nitrogen fixation NifU-like protein